VPWARGRSGVTLLFEAKIMKLVDQMPVKTIAEMEGVQDTRLWRVIEHYVTRALEQSDLSKVRRVGVDETSSRKGHKYVSLFVDLDTNKVIFVGKGKDSLVLQAFREHLIKHGGDPESITDFSCDISPAFIHGIETLFPNAHITFDKFLSSLQLKTGRAYRMKLVFQYLFKPGPVLFNREEALKKWYAWAIRSRIEPMVIFAKTLKRHWNGIVRWFTSHITNAILEGLNSLVQAAKARS